MTGEGSYHVGQKVTIKAEAKDENSYTWRGWYSNNRLYTMDMSFDYIVKRKNTTFESRWSNIMINVYCYSNTDNNYENLENAEMILKFENNDKEMNGVEYGVDKELYNEVLEKPDYKFLGWYYDTDLQQQATGEDGVLKESKLDKIGRAHV